MDNLVQDVLLQEYEITAENELISFILKVFEIDKSAYADLKVIYANNSSYRVFFDLFKDKLPLTIYVEQNYVDRTYRDSYYLYYASKYRRYKRFCKRLFVFNTLYKEIQLSDIPAEELQKHFMGTMVIRPLEQGKIGRSLLNPAFFLSSDSCLRFAHYKAVMFEKELKVDAFPFSMQDGETTTCSETTILNMIDFFSNKYQDYCFALPSGISGIVDQHGYERTLPSKGMEYSEISRVFSEMGFFPRLYSRSSFQNINQLKRNMHYYVESGIPVAVGVERIETHDKHAVTCIGHVKVNPDLQGVLSTCPRRTVYKSADESDLLWVIDTADLIKEYIFMDDGKKPYITCKWSQYDATDFPWGKNEIKIDLENVFDKRLYAFDNLEPKTMMVPLYKSMFLEAEDAFDIFMKTLSSREVGIKRYIPKDDKDQLLYGTRQNPLIVRVFLASSRHFRQMRLRDMIANQNEASTIYASVLFPKFVWVCEIYTPEGYCSENPKAIGELVLDATSSSIDTKSKSVIIFHYFNNIWICNMSDIQDCEPNAIDKDVNDCCNKSGQIDYFYEIDNWIELEPYQHNLGMPTNESIETKDEKALANSKVSSV